VVGEWCWFSRSGCWGGIGGVILTWGCCTTAQVERPCKIAAETFDCEFLGGRKSYVAYLLGREMQRILMRMREWEFCVTFSFFFGFRKGGHIDLTFFLITLKHNTISPLPSIGRWLHFMIASTACEILENSISPDDERSVFKGNRRTDVAGTSLMLKIPISWSSVKPGGVLKKCKI